MGGLANWTGCIPGDLDASGCMIGSAAPLYSKQEIVTLLFVCVQARVFPFSQVITSGIRAAAYTIYLRHEINRQALPKLIVKYSTFELFARNDFIIIILYRLSNKELYNNNIIYNSDASRALLISVIIKAKYIMWDMTNIFYSCIRC